MEEETDMVVEFDPYEDLSPSLQECAAIAYYAIGAISEMDCELLGQAAKKKRKNIELKSLAILNKSINEIHKLLFSRK